MREPRLLVTFALFTYNQEAYVAEAVEGALSQDYSPLEIIISDDASTDRTFEISQRLFRDYRGPHEVRLIRNEANLGIGAHVTKVANLAQGELIVAAAGDDVSLPGRTRAMTALWEAHDRKPDLLCCDAEIIDVAGQVVRTYPAFSGRRLTDVQVARDGEVVLGALATWSRRLWDVHRELPAGCISEDQVLSLRAAMLGGVVRHPEALVRYRIGSGISDAPDPSQLERYLNHQRWWTAEVLKSLNFQSEDARQATRADLERYLHPRAQTMALIDALYRGDSREAVRRWRGAANRRSLRIVVSAIAQTRMAPAYLTFLKCRAWLRP